MKTGSSWTHPASLTLFLTACVALIISWGGGHIDPTTLEALGEPKYVP